MATHSSVLAWNPRDGAVWWAAVYGVAESDTNEATWQQTAAAGNNLWSLTKKMLMLVSLNLNLYGKVF